MMLTENFSPAFFISSSGMSAQRIRMNTISANLANANTTRTPEGGPYRKQTTVLSARYDYPEFVPLPEETSVTDRDQNLLMPAHTSEGHMPLAQFRPRDPIGLGVKVEGIVEDMAEPRLVYDPEHPDANGEGYVAYPNITVSTEMVDLISATRAYEANVTAFNSYKTMLNKALEIGRA